MIAVVTLTKVEQRHAQVVARRRERLVRLQRLASHFDGAGRVLQLPLRLAKQGKEFRIARRLRKTGFQFFARPRGPAEIEIQAGKIEPHGREARIQVQRLAELADRFTLEILRPQGAIRHAEEHVRLGRAWIDRQDLLQLAHVVGDVLRAGEEVRLARSSFSRIAAGAAAA